jgi:hypothetical protein
VQRYAGSQFGIPVMKYDTVIEYPANHAHDVFGLEWGAQLFVCHGPAGAIAHLGILQVHACLREQVMISGVVVMHVRDDDIRHLRVRDPDRPQALIHRAYQGAPALLRLLRVESGVDDYGALRSHYRPDEVVQGHGSVVGIAAQEVVAGGTLEMRVADCENLVVDTHGRSGYLTKDRINGLLLTLA